MKIAIIYHTKSGNTEKVAYMIAEGIKESDNCDVKCMKIDEIDYSYLEQAEAVIFGTPTYYASLSWEIKKWFDTSWVHKLGGKLGGAFATEDYLGGGADTALLSLIGLMLVKGMIVYSSGGAEGHPYIHYGPVCIKDGTLEQQQRARVFGNRFANKTCELLG